jgi:hypothetical protein
MNDAMVVGGLFVVLGIALLTGVGWLYAQARESVSWPSTSGRIVSADREASTGRGQGTTSYRLVLSYEYSVAAQRFAGHRVSFGDLFFTWTRSSSEAERRRQRYPPGGEVTVWYDAKRPERCTLVNGLGDAPFYPAISVALILAAAGVAAMLGLIRVG